MLRRLSTQMLRPDVLVSMSPALVRDAKSLALSLALVCSFSSCCAQVQRANKLCKDQGPALRTAAARLSAPCVSSLSVLCLHTQRATSPHPTTTRACHACKRKRTFSTVWHWEHLVLKILAPFSADMARWWWCWSGFLCVWGGLWCTKVRESPAKARALIISLHAIRSTHDLRCSRPSKNSRQLRS